MSLNTQVTFGQDSVKIYNFPFLTDLQVNVHCIVTKVSNEISYCYQIENDSNSEQKMDDFYLDIYSSIMRINSPKNWWGVIPNLSEPMMWFSMDTTAMVNIGGQLNGFEIVSSGLPTISIFYSPGYVEDIIQEEGADSVENDNVFENSYKGWTIAPKDVSGPFDYFYFIDTIKYYINQSHSLGWITSQQTVNNYTLLFDTVRVLIERGSGGAARRTLDLVLTNVELDNTTTLTSEAYALIRFNTEYLKEHLP